MHSDVTKHNCSGVDSHSTNLVLADIHSVSC